jgi:Ni/Co efflux regulator RcnB
MKRILIVAIAAVWATGAFAQDARTRELIRLWHQENSTCRGSSDPVRTEPACRKRADLSSRLDERGWCYGKEGEIGADHRWHRCARGSVRYEGDYER